MVTPMQYDRFFWLHIKKSAGLTTAKLLQPYYVKLPVPGRVRKPRNFIQSDIEEYNDVLNNYRVVLGEYNFRRCLFAKKYLYKERWEDLHSFAFSREPVDRCISMFFYLFWDDPGLIKYRQFVRFYIQMKKLIVSRSYAFDVFLDMVVAAQENVSIYQPLGDHFSTHTNPMWRDITDDEGNVLLKQVYRLENLIEGVNQVFEICGIDERREKVTRRSIPARLDRSSVPPKLKLKKSSQFTQTTSRFSRN